MLNYFNEKEPTKRRVHMTADISKATDIVSRQTFRMLDTNMYGEDKKMTS